MPHKKCKTVYFFNELSDDAKEKAREWYRDGALDYDWYDSIYEDAERCGLKITSFDLGNRREITGKLTMSLEDSIKAILNDHGNACDTFKLATEYRATLDGLVQDGENDDAREALEEDYMKALCEEYLSMLDKEIEYLMADEQVDETIIANEYEFTEDGRRAR